MSTKKEVEEADKARRLQEILGYTSTQELKTIVEHNVVKNCDVIVGVSIKTHKLHMRWHFGKKNLKQLLYY